MNDSASGVDEFIVAFSINITLAFTVYVTQNSCFEEVRRKGKFLNEFDDVRRDGHLGNLFCSRF